MKKIVKIILIVLSIWIVMFITDFICVRTIERPIFMIRTGVLKDGGTKEYYGIFYKVIKCNTSKGDNSIKMGTWFMKYTCDNEVKEENTTVIDSVEFSKEYSTVDTSNVFVYRDIDEIINILKNGTGIIYLGFPECQWCQAYVPYLNEVAKENDLEKIYYFNILEDRKNKTDKYMEIVNILKFYLQYDEEGIKRVYVPAIIAVKEGEIIGFDDETAYDVEEYDSPSEYWTDNRVEALKNKLTTMIQEVNKNVCTDCNK